MYMSEGLLFACAAIVFITGFGFGVMTIAQLNLWRLMKARAPE